MKKPVFKEKYDVIIIGSGVSGLTSAALLSRAGISVCVLEMDNRPGGYLAGFRRKDFRFDTAIHWLNQCGPEGLVYRTFTFIGNDFPKPRQQKLIRRYKSADFDYLLTDNPDELKARWIADFPHERKGIERFFRDAKKLGLSFKILGYNYRSMETMNLFEKARFGLKMLQFVRPFFRHLRFSGDEGVVKGLKRYFQDPRLLSVFCSEQDVLSCMVPIGWAYYHDYQLPPDGGSQVFPEWLSYVTRHLGGEVHFRCRVEKIVLENGDAAGVQVDCRGEKFELKSDYVIAACDVETLYEKMLPPEAVPETLKEKLRKAPLYSSSVTISVGLDCTAEQLGFGEEMVFISETGIPRKAHSDTNPDTSGICILAPSLRDPSLAPENMSTLTLYTAGDMHYADNWGATKDPDGNWERGEEYYRVKEEYTRIIFDRVEARYPGFKEHIVMYDVATPVTHQRYTGNRNGSIMGARPGKENVKAKIAHHTTPVKRLFLSGHWAELGGGVPIAVKTGANAALLILREAKSPAFRLLADYMDGKQNLEQVQRHPVMKPYDHSWIQELTPADKKRKGLKNGPEEMP
jgi:prolycopene isomerase